MTLEQARAEGLANAEYGLRRLRNALVATPADKVEWSPGPTAKSVLAIASHCVDANQGIAMVLRGEENGGGPDWSFRLPDLATAVAELDRTGEALKRAIEGVTPELFETSPQTPGGPLPMANWMTFPGSHLAEHAAQIDYLQTCWDDQETRY
ncbi:MAG: DinB family protein [Fimbriimonadaceae bacterium]|nr:DinB family protein [Fimbriimonadaceae bacterium]QYK57431.1 MAG: DinB family protein [Fimbriimonadaceae bacterium]